MGETMKGVVRPLAVLQVHAFVDEGSEPDDVHGGDLNIVKHISEPCLHTFDASVVIRRPRRQNSGCDVPVSACGLKFGHEFGSAAGLHGLGSHRRFAVQFVEEAGGNAAAAVRTGWEQLRPLLLSAQRGQRNAVSGT